MSHAQAAARFVRTALAAAPHVTDKVPYRGQGHSYQLLYGVFLMPLIGDAGGLGVRLLEIGLGCDMNMHAPRTTQGRSARLWRTLMPNATIFAAEFDGLCVQRQRSLWEALRVHVLVGDQSNETTLSRWVHETQGNLDVVVDDGSHKNSHILASFERLWPTVRPGGIYILEDLMVGRTRVFDDTGGAAVLSDVLQAWTDQLIIPEHTWGNPNIEMSSATSADAVALRKRVRAARTRHPLPAGVAFVFCQQEACVVGKEAKSRRGSEGTRE